MSQVCILTDSTAQFTSPAFCGHELVSVIPFHIWLGDREFIDGHNLRAKDLRAKDLRAKDLRAKDLPASALKGLRLRLLPPAVDAFHRCLASLRQKYAEIVIILLSSHLSQAYDHALEAADSYRAPAAVHLVDSQTTAVGLGLLVQAAAAAAHAGACGAEINRLMLSCIPRIYTLFYVQGLTYLVHAGRLDPAQALVGEMLGITPYLILENGRLVCHRKASRPEHLLGVFQEFLSEFESLRHAAILQGAPPFIQETHSLHEHIHASFPKTALSEHTPGAALAALFGPRSLGLVVMEGSSCN